MVLFWKINEPCEHVHPLSGTGSYRIDRNNKWIILTAENGKKNVLYYTTGKGNKVESLSMKLTVGTSTMVPGPMLFSIGAFGKQKNHNDKNNRKPDTNDFEWRDVFH